MKKCSDVKSKWDILLQECIYTVNILVKPVYNPVMYEISFS